MGLFGKRPKRVTHEPSWGGPPPSGPLRFASDVRTAAELVGQPAPAAPVAPAASAASAVSEPAQHASAA